MENPQPVEAIVLFIDPKPALSNEFYSFLKVACSSHSFTMLTEPQIQPILSQTSSLILPYVYKSASISTTSQDILFEVPAGQKIVVANTQTGDLKRDQLVV